ncbi:unnamed protein product [Closterium sp. NIES-64]|nr:unnamed protein product [Closterium sp. NIES-64]
MRPLLCVLHVGLSALFAGERGATADDVIHFLAEAAHEATLWLIRAGLAAATQHSSGDGTQGPHQPPTRLQTCIACPTPPPLFPLSSPQRPTIALVMGPKGLISRLLALTLNNACPRPTIALVMGPNGLISRLLAPRFNDVSLVMGSKGLISRLLAPRISDVIPADLVLFPPRHTPHPSSLPPPFTPAPHHSVGHGALVMGPKGLISRNAQRAARSGTTNDGGVENATASSHPSVPPLPVGGGGDGEGIHSTSSMPTLPIGGGGDVEGIPSTPSVPPLPAGGGHHANGSMSLPTASPSTMNGMLEDREADKSMALVREEMRKRDIPAEYVAVDGRWSHVREGEWCTVSFMDVPSRKTLYCVTTRKGVDDQSLVRLEWVAFDRGVDELKLLGFDVKGIISGQGTTFRDAAAKRKLDHQLDWWHVKRTLYNLFCKELQDHVWMAVEVDKASCVKELWLAKLEDLRQWLRTKGLEKEAKGTLKASLVKAVCEAMGTIAYVNMTPDEAQWKFPGLREVRRLGGERAAVDVLVGYCEVRPDTTGEMQPIVRDAAVDETNGGATQVDVQWANVKEL